MRTRQQAFHIIAGLALIALLILVGSTRFGSIAMDWSQWGRGLMASLGAQHNAMDVSLIQLRLERAELAFCVGASLGLAGVMMQALLRNPLADPYVLGISSGASVGALLALFFYGAYWLVGISAFAGALCVSLLLFALARRDFRAGVSESGLPLLLLTGVVISAGCGALITLMLSIAPDGRLRSMVFWLMGDLSGAQAGPVQWVVLFCSALFAMSRARAINLFAMFAEGAGAIGVSVRAMSLQLYLCAALLTASSVAVAGAVGFVGLIVPHACRFALGADHRILLPASALMGGTLLVLADTLARTVIAPEQLPVGVVTSLIGVPAFLWQLHQARRA